LTAEDRFPLPAVFSKPAVAFSTIKPVSEAISSNVVRAHFEQRKNIAGLSKPILSSGEFLYASDRGVYWHSTKPFDMTYLVTAKGVTRREEGQLDVELKADDHPAIRGFSTIFLAMFSGELGGLERSFEAHFSGDLSSWVIGLKATDPDVKRFIAAIVLSGGDAVQEVELYEGNGDSTLITFTDTATKPPTLTAEEQSRFGG
jgi:hypothetical protein